LRAAAAHADTSTWLSSSNLRPDQMACPWTRVGAVAPFFTGDGSLLMQTTTFDQDCAYEQSGPEITMPDGILVIEFEMRIVHGDGRSRLAAPTILFETSPFTGGAVCFGFGIYTMVSATVKGPREFPGGSELFHKFRIEVSGLIAGSQIRVFQDGFLVTTGSTFTDSSETAGLSLFNGYPRIVWGDASNQTYGGGNWRSFSHNAATPGCSVVATRRSTWGTLKTSYR
jgi:hypothetical protein